MSIDGIPKPLCSLHYVTADDVIYQVIKLGKGALLAKIDIKSAFRLLPVHPEDKHLLQMVWDDSVYVDMCLSFGLRSAPKLFNVAADLLQWGMQQQGVTNIMHYLRKLFSDVGPSRFTGMSKQFRHHQPYLQQPWSSTGSRESRRPFNHTNFLGNYNRHS